ncbi:fimbria/pilus outer membrane usher protein [Cupriavidus sp. D39]|uniref:fimbria/pilus outer membrane usher protein n=1 Tax=Cupriavidus sp. D39 TaxID=2997877 RepID=UPI002271C3A5|nr:fimbria/pilus outer membrane usher protein [Cupriavidus sp. D39]MCY0858728.1 fimbria/pilus outer membrane usher protein [Cupriavidus sp. D39]
MANSGIAAESSALEKASMRSGPDAPLAASQAAGATTFPSATSDKEFPSPSTAIAVDPAVTPARPQGLPAKRSGAQSKILSSASNSSAASGPHGMRLLPLEIVLNGANVGSWTLLESHGELYAPAEAFEEWRVTLKHGEQAIEYRNQRWYALGAVPGYRGNLDFSSMSLDAKFSVQAFIATHIATEQEMRPTVAPAIPAVFANYDLSFTTIAQKGSPATQDLGALTELGMTGRLGVLTSSFYGSNLAGANAGLPPQVRRLETTLTRDFPSSNTTLRLGDSSTRARLMGRPVYFGGIQIGRNYALNPGFTTQPIPVLAGTAGAPSTVELYINDALRQTSSVPTGPFTINNAPQISGGGEARLVVRDVLGRETVVSQPFFTHADLLEQSLHDWSAELGATRQNLGTANADYGEKFVSGLWRYGWSKSLTVEARGEIGKATRDVSMGSTIALPWQTLGQAAVAASSRAHTGSGQQWLLGLERAGTRHSFLMHAEGASAGYRWIGNPDNESPRWQFSGNYNYTSESFGSFGAAFGKVHIRSSGIQEFRSLSYSLRIGQAGSVTLSATQARGAATSGAAFGISFVIPLGNQASVFTSVTQRSGRTEGYTSANKGLTAETGTAWRTLAGRRGGELFSEGGLYYQSTRMLLTADATAGTAQQALRLGAQGGMVAADGQIFVTRTVQDSFAIVEVPGYADIGVGFQGSKLTRTDSDGVALLPRLQPYVNNNIRLDPTELPISAELDSIEQTVAPSWRSAVKVRFPVRSGRGALLTIRLDDGEPAPAGAEIELIGDHQTFFVARRGEAFVTGLQPSNELRLKWKGVSCRMNVELPSGGIDEIVRIGPLACSGVKP